MTTGRAVPPAEEPEEPAELTITIRIPRGLKLRKIIELEEAMAAGVGPMVGWLVANAGADREQLLNLSWEQIGDLRNAIQQAVKEAGQVPPRRS